VLVALQPVQLVSIAEPPGVTEKTAFEEFAETSPLPQPAAKSSAGAKSSERFLRSGFRIVKPCIYCIDSERKRKKARNPQDNRSLLGRCYKLVLNGN
jgi:hypothetical protein